MEKGVGSCKYWRTRCFQIGHLRSIHLELGLSAVHRTAGVVSASVFSVIFKVGAGREGDKHTICREYGFFRIQLILRKQRDF